MSKDHSTKVIAHRSKLGPKFTSLNTSSRYNLPHSCIWQAILALKVFDQNGVEAWLIKQQYFGIESTNIKNYLKRLLLAEYIAIRGKKTLPEQKTITYTLVKNNCSYAPSLTKRGELCQKGRHRESMWRSMKALKSFDYRDLAREASTEQFPISSREANQYIQGLERAHYLRCTQPMKLIAGVKTPAKYTLISNRNTGFQPPCVQKIIQVYDPNLNQIMWTQKPIETCDE